MAFYTPIDKTSSLLSHNSVLGAKALLFPDHERGAFLKGKVNDIEIYIVALTPFLSLCKKAVERFLNDADEIVPKSKQGAKFQ